MIKVENIEIEIQCPKCNFYNYFRIKQAQLRDVIICRGCKANIQLDDQMNTVRKTIRDIEKAMRKFENSLQNFKMII